MFESDRLSPVPSSRQRLGVGDQETAIVSQQLGTAYDNELTGPGSAQNSDPDWLSPSAMKQAPYTADTNRSQVIRESEKTSLTETDAMSTADSGFDSTFSLIQLRKSTDRDTSDSQPLGRPTRATSDSQPSGRPTRATVGITHPVATRPLLASAGDLTTAGIIPSQTNSTIGQRSLSMDSTCPSVPAFGMHRARQNSSQARRSSLESKKRWSPHISERSSFSLGFEPLTPSLKGWEEDAVFEIWVASSDAHHTMATVLEYSGKFLSVEVCMCICVNPKILYNPPPPPPTHTHTGN